MKTYAETQNEKPFDWNAFLDRAIKGVINKGEINNAIILSSMWTTCACGNQCDIIPRNENGRPRDNQLWEYGTQFSIDIDNRDFVKARNTLALIEKRSAHLIEQIKNEN